jgi:hypothetical protein
VRARRWPLVQHGVAATGDQRRRLRPKEGEEGAGQVGPNGQVRSGFWEKVMESGWAAMEIGPK